MARGHAAGGGVRLRQRWGLITSVGLRVDGSVACWGGDYYGQATPPEGEFASVSAGSRAHLRIEGWTAPSPAGGAITMAKATPPEGEFASVSAGEDHTCGLRVDGSVACWG